MPQAPSQRSLESEFDALMSRAGLTIPPARRAGYLVAFSDLRNQIALLNVRRDPTIEPANVFRVTPPECGR
jgi:hypothetical protein